MFSDEAAKGHPTAPPVTVYIPDNGRPVIDLAALPDADTGS
jgi:hypothetical protein